MPGFPKVGTEEQAFGPHAGYYQLPDQGLTAECMKQAILGTGDDARIVKITRYDGKTADGVFVTTWQETQGERRKMWAGGTFVNAPVMGGE